MSNISERKLRSRIFYTLLFSFGLLTTIMLLAILNKLILPTLIGILLAYLLHPFLVYLQKKGFSKSISVGVLLTGIILFFVLIGREVSALFPTQQEQLVLRVQVQSKMNDIYLDVFGKPDFKTQGNFLDELFGQDVQPLIVTINEFLNLDEQEEEEFKAQIYTDKYSESERIKILNHHGLNKEIIGSNKSISETLKIENGKEENSNFLPLPSLIPTSKIALFFGEVSKWIIMPFVFLFILIDDGQIRKFIISLVPNRYFEMSFSIFNNVDEAIGNYLRGTIVQSSLVGLIIFIGLWFIGFNTQAAIFIGVVAGISNAIPFLGPLIGYGAGIVYALIVEEIHPIIPFLPQDAGLWGVIVVVFVAQLIDNAVLQPYVLGKAVNLHPLVVVLGVTGGSIAFGFWGMFLAIPTIVVFRVIISTFYKELKAYQLIE